MKILIRNRQRHRPLNKPRITRTARKILSFLEQPKAELSILFVGNRKMIQLNNKYRGKRKTTDVLSFGAAFPIKNAGNEVLGDIVISVPKAEQQAREYGISFYDEISRLMVHGTLHLLGYDHEASDYMAGKMRKKEEELFNLCR